MKLLRGLATAAALAMATSAAIAQSDVAADLKILIIGDAAQLQIVNDAVGRFNADYPNVKVQVDLDSVPNGWGDFATRVLAQIQAGNAYDVYNTAIESFRLFEESGQFLPLEEHIASVEDYKAFDKALFSHSSYEGHTYFVPVGWNNIMINYNRDHFDAAGLAYPSETWTWEDFRKAATALTKRDADGNVTQYGYEVPTGNFMLQPWFFSNGTSILNADWTASNMLDPKVSETLQFLYDLVHVDKVSPIPAAGYSDSQFLAGQMSMISRGRWILPPAKDAKLNMDVAIPPAKVSNATVIGFGGYAVPVVSKHQDLAMALLPYLSTYETQAGTANGIPGRRDAAESPEFLAFPPSAKLYYQTLPTTIPVPSPANFQEVEEIFLRHYFAIMSDEESIADAVKAADSEMSASFERLKQK